MSEIELVLMTVDETDRLSAAPTPVSLGLS